MKLSPIIYGNSEIFLILIIIRLCYYYGVSHETRVCWKSFDVFCATTRNVHGKQYSSDSHNVSRQILFLDSRTRFISIQYLGVEITCLKYRNLMTDIKQSRYANGPRAPRSTVLQWNLSMLWASFFGLWKLKITEYKNNYLLNYLHYSS